MEIPIVPRNLLGQWWLRLGVGVFMAVSVGLGRSSAGQAQQAAPKPGDAMQMEAASPTPLATLIEEAKKNDPTIQAAALTAKAATLTAPQIATLPDPEFTLQQFSVGSPRPFAGYTNSDFAYLGVGVSQQLPYPGKLRLRGAVANAEADTAKAHLEVVSEDELELLKTTYVHVAYLQQTLGILQRNAALLQQIEQDAEAQYSSGKGNQQDVLKAQLQRTKLLREISMHHQLAGEDQATIKRLLRRPQDSPDITAEPLSASFLRYTAGELLERVSGQNANIQEAAASIQRNRTAVEKAERDFRPDFDFSYMYENTDRKYRDYYVLSLTVNLPRRKPRDAALAQARVNVERAQQEQDIQLQGALAEVQKQYVAIKASEEQLQIYRDGLILQAQATIQAGLAAYQSNREDFETLFSSYLDVLNLDLEYQQTLLDHETAMARIERLTGVSIP